MKINMRCSKQPMKRNKTLDFLSLLFCSCFVSVVAQNPHVHGDVNLNIVKDNSQLEIDLISPSVNIIGFEHAASSNEERMVLEKANNLLVQHELIFSFQDEWPSVPISGMGYYFSESAALRDGAIKKLTDVTKLHQLGWKHSTNIEKGISLMYSCYLSKSKS